MVNDVAAERFWWDGLTPEEIKINTEGVPPYDAEACAVMIMNEMKIESNARYLDLGCGTGRTARAVMDRMRQHWLADNTIVGLDISPAIVREARLSTVHCSIHYDVCDGRTLPKSPALFDGAWAITLFQHIPKTAMYAYINRVCRRLRAGAKFSFTVAIGDEDMFLNHQLSESDVQVLIFSMCDQFSRVKTARSKDGWTWIEAWK